MQREHRDSIQKNFSSLVEQTDLDLMVAALYEKGVFSDPMIEPYRDTSKDARTRKRLLYRDITRRGPDAFGNLLDALSENGYWDLVRDLDPTSSLHLRNTRPNANETGESSFLSLSGTRKTKTRKEQNDPNRNWALQSTSYSNSSGNKAVKNDLEQNCEHYGPLPAEYARLGDTPEQMANVPHFNVIKSTKFIEDVGNDIKQYRTRGRKRGVMVLFSYQAYVADIEEFRHGAEVDAVNLRYLFSELGFFKVLSYLNLSLKETKQTLSELKHTEGMSPAGPETMFIVFSSHGYQRAGTGDNDIRCSDGGLISYYEIIDYFSNERFPALCDVPKVFIFQTCRGINKEFTTQAPRHMRAPSGRAGAAAVGAAQARGAPAGGGGDAPAALMTDGSTSYSDEQAEGDNSKNRMYSDILIAHSTVPGYASHRDPVRGSWYIQALCDVFAAHAHDTHVEDLFTLVDKRLDTQTSSVDRWGFNHRLYLHPGLYED